MTFHHTKSLNGTVACAVRSAFSYKDLALPRNLPTTTSSHSHPDHGPTNPNDPRPKRQDNVLTFLNVVTDAMNIVKDALDMIPLQLRWRYSHSDRSGSPSGPRWSIVD